MSDFEDSQPADFIEGEVHHPLPRYEYGAILGSCSCSAIAVETLKSALCFKMGLAIRATAYVPAT